MTAAGITLRTAEVREAKKLFALIQANLEEGHLLPRTLGELTAQGRQVPAEVPRRQDQRRGRPQSPIRWRRRPRPGP